MPTRQSLAFHPHHRPCSPGVWWHQFRTHQQSHLSHEFLNDQASARKCHIRCTRKNSLVWKARKISRWDEKLSRRRSWPSSSASRRPRTSQPPRRTLLFCECFGTSILIIFLQKSSCRPLSGRHIVFESLTSSISGAWLCYRVSTRP
jgi:hypothetical protein